MDVISDKNCTLYVYKYEDLLIPPIDIFDYLCTSHDKTYIFIISLIRVLIIAVIITIYYNVTGLKGIWIIGYIFLIIYIFINIIILFLILLKQQKIPKE